MTGTGNDFQHVGLGSPDIAKLVAKIEKVTFGGVDATNVTIDSDTELTAETPAAPSSVATIEVVTPGGTASAPVQYTYVPQITGVSPNNGPLEGLTTVTVIGHALAANLTFLFGGSAATGVSANAPGVVNVVAQTPSELGSSPITSADQFTCQGPFITAVNPSAGPTTRATTVIVTGTSLNNNMTVSFGGANATGIACSNSTSCWAFTPAHAAGPVHLTVTANGVTSAPSSAEFTYQVFPTITGISPAAAPTGATVTLTGTGFVPGETSFLFFGLAVSGNCSSTATCTAAVPNVYPNGWTSQDTAVYVSVNGIVSQDSVSFEDTTPPPPPTCTGNKCM